MENNINMDTRKWYIVQVVTGYEQKVKEELENRDFDGINNNIEILFPRSIHTTKSGQTKMKPMFPGYLYVKVEMTDDSWFIIRNTNYVTGIVGSSGQRTKPTPVREEEILKIKEKALEEKHRFENIKLENANKAVITETEYKIGDTVKISSGEFANQDGKVLSISIENQRTTVEIEFFGRMTTIDIELDQVKKI